MVETLQGGAPSSYKRVIIPWTLDISAIKHSYWTCKPNVAIPMGHHPVWISIWKSSGWEGAIKGACQGYTEIAKPIQPFAVRSYLGFLNRPVDESWDKPPFSGAGFGNHLPQDSMMFLSTPDWNRVGKLLIQCFHHLRPMTFANTVYSWNLKEETLPQNRLISYDGLTRFFRVQHLRQPTWQDNLANNNPELNPQVSWYAAIFLLILRRLGITVFLQKDTPPKTKKVEVLVV